MTYSIPLFSLLSLVTGQAPTVPPFTVVPHIHGVPPLRSQLVIDAQCREGAARLAIQSSLSGPKVTGLTASGRSLGKADLTRLNGWLTRMRTALSAQIDCTGGGVVLYIAGPDRSKPGETYQVSAGWITEGLFKLP